MSLEPKCESAWNDFERDVALTKNKKMPAIHGSSILPQHDSPRYLNPSSRRRKRGLSSGWQIERSPSSKRRMRSRNEEGAGSEPSFTPRSFAKTLSSKDSIHTADCCRLILPAEFFRKHTVERSVTMTDSAGRKLWHMRFQPWAWSKEPSLFIISNGWREFSYEHGLKVNDRLVFTLMSSSHFVVEFATSNGSTRAMFPTREVESYPWLINYKRLDCLASANQKVQLQAVKEKQIRKKAQVVKEKQIRKKVPTAKEKQIRKKAQVVKEKQIRKKVPTAKEKQIRKKAQVVKEKQIRKKVPIAKVKQIRKKAQVVKEKQIRKKVPTVKEKQIRKKAQVVQEKQIRKKTQAVKVRGIRQKLASIRIPNKQKLQKEKFCQCNTVGIGKNLTANSRKEYVFPEFTHLECKNPDGSTYLQILDSGSEVSVVDED